MSSDADGRERDRIREIADSHVASETEADWRILAREVLRLGERLDEYEGTFQGACFYCGWRGSLQKKTTEGREIVSVETKAHVVKCRAHPMAALRRENAELHAAAQPIQQGERIEGEEYERVRQALHRAAAVAYQADEWVSLYRKLPPGASLIVQQPDASEDKGAGPGEAVRAGIPAKSPEPSKVGSPARTPTAPEDASEGRDERWRAAKDIWSVIGLVRGELGDEKAAEAAARKLDSLLDRAFLSHPLRARGRGTGEAGGGTGGRGSRSLGRRPCRCVRLVHPAQPCRLRSPLPRGAGAGGVDGGLFGHRLSAHGAGS